MLLVCPGCKANFAVDDANIDEAGVKLRCFRCKTVFKVVRKKRVPHPRGAGAVADRPSQVVKFVVAHESQSFCEAVKRVLANEPFLVYDSTDGGEAMAIIERVKPDAVLLDVALPTMYGFEICEAMRQKPDLTHTKIILLAAIYDKRRYRRDPASLHGADQVIEKHRIPDQLIPLVYELLNSVPEEVGTAGGGEPEPLVAEEQEWLAGDTAIAGGGWPSETDPVAGPGLPAGEWLAATADASGSSLVAGINPPLADETPVPPPMPVVEIETPAVSLPQEVAQSFVEEITVGEPFVAGASPVVPQAAAEGSEAHEKARRLARIIVSDIALYNPEKVATGVKAGTIRTLLAEEYAEGEALYVQRISAEVRTDTAYLEEAFQQLIDKKRREFGV